MNRAHATLAAVIEPLPALLIPGLLASAWLYAAQIPDVEDLSAELRAALG